METIFSKSNFINAVQDFMKYFNTSYKLLSIILICVLSPFSCSSYKIVREYSTDGKVIKIKGIDSGDITDRIDLEYNNASRLTKALRYREPKKELSGTRKFTYDRSGRLRIQYNNSIHHLKGRKVLDIWVESFFYNNSGRLSRAETSFKSSFSIAKNKTPIEISHYDYKGDFVSRIRINGGVFRKIIVPKYKKKKLVSLEYTYLSLNRNHRRYEKQMHYTFSLKNRLPKSAINSEGKDVTPADKATQIYINAKIDDYLRKPVYAIEPKGLIQELEIQWLYH